MGLLGSAIQRREHAEDVCHGLDLPSAPFG